MHTTKIISTVKLTNTWDNKTLGEVNGRAMKLAPKRENQRNYIWGHNLDSIVSGVTGPKFLGQQKYKMGQQIFYKKLAIKIRNINFVLE